MGSVDDNSFACDACGKKYKWKESLAGKRVRCRCGSAMQVPDRQAPPDDDDLPDLAEAAGGEIFVPARAGSPTPGASKKTSVPSSNPHYFRKGLQNETNRSSDGMTDLVRDLYVPSGMLVAGFLGAIVWVVSQTKAGGTGVAVVSTLSVLGTLLKTAVLIGLAFVIAPLRGISFGSLWSAVLKFAGTVIFSDSLLLWVHAIFKATGGISASGKTSILILCVDFGVIAVVITAAWFYLFSMDVEDVVTFALPIGAASVLLEWGLSVLVVTATHHGGSVASGAKHNAPTLGGSTPIIDPGVSTAEDAVITESSTPPPAASNVPATPPPPAPPPPPDHAPETAMDHRMFLHVAKDWTHVQEVRTWCTVHPDAKLQLQLANKLYDAGAVTVFIELHVGTSGDIIVDLPADPAKQDACMQAAHQYFIDHKMPEQAPTTSPFMTRYLVFPFID